MQIFKRVVTLAIDHGRVISTAKKKCFFPFEVVRISWFIYAINRHYLSALLCMLFCLLSCPFVSFCFEFDLVFSSVFNCYYFLSLTNYSFSNVYIVGLLTISLQIKELQYIAFDICIGIDIYRPHFSLQRYIIHKMGSKSHQCQSQKIRHAKIARSIQRHFPESTGHLQKSFSMSECGVGEQDFSAR